MENTLSYQAYLKSPYKSIKHSTYFEVYDFLLSRYRGKKIVFVEIGVLGGGSLFMWRYFFGSEARIIGVDLNPNAKKWEKDGFEIYIGSQSDENFWRDFVEKVGPIDVILDDGGHTYLQQITTCELMLPSISQGGMLIVEDTHTSYMSGFGPNAYSFIRYVTQMIDRINFRSGRLNGANMDKKVWSIQIFDSIVAFNINHNALKVSSISTTNGGVDDAALDFRHQYNFYYAAYKMGHKYLNYLKYIPGMKKIAFFSKNFASNRTGSIHQLKKYFKK